jgi:uncharacterized protein (DUF1501 family)
MRRRELLLSSLALGGALAARRALARPAGRETTVVLVQLAGGNDALNTLVPVRDPAYRSARPGLALDDDEVEPLTRDLAVHGALTPLLPLWRERALAMVQSVGYAGAGRSHFRSSDFWAQGGEGRGAEHGWVARALSGAPAERRRQALCDALVLGDDGRAAAGPGVRALHVDARRKARLPDVGGPRPAAGPQTAALEHLLRTRDDLRASRGRLQRALAARPRASVDFPGTPLGRQLAFASRVLAAGERVPCVLVKQGGFDTHSRQRGRHADRLTALAAALASFAAALRTDGLWRDVVVVTWSEFGRRVAQNASGGTDHGGAGLQLLFGGRVRGGLFGEPASLDDLDDGDLRPTTDFRSVYATLTRDAWRLSSDAVARVAGQHAPLPGLLVS